MDWKKLDDYSATNDSIMTRKGWFIIPGVQHGDRTVEQQQQGLQDALAEARGKTVLDLGCAEGLLSIEFAKAGAVEVHGIELLADHLAVARSISKGYPQISYRQGHLDDLALSEPTPKQFDIVLALGVIHKPHDPNVPLRYAIDSTRNLLLLRAPAKARLGQIYSKFTSKYADVPAVMKKSGFVFEKKIPGVLGEAVEYWRRKA